MKGTLRSFVSAARRLGHLLSERITRFQFRFFKRWIQAFTAFGGALFLVVYLAELGCMLLTHAQVRNIEEASYVLYVQSDFWRLEQATLKQRAMFSMAAWVFDFNKIILYSFIIILTFSVAQVFNRIELDGIPEQRDTDQLEKLNNLRPYSSAFCIPLALLLTDHFAGAALHPVSSEPTSLWGAFKYQNLGLVLYRLLFLSFLAGWCWFFCISVRLVILGHWHNKKCTENQRIHFRPVPELLGFLIICIVAIWFSTLFTGPGTTALIAKRWPQLIIGTVLVGLLTCILPGRDRAWEHIAIILREGSIKALATLFNRSASHQVPTGCTPPTTYNAQPHLQPPWAAILLVGFPLLIVIASAHLGGNLLVEKRGGLFITDEQKAQYKRLDHYLDVVMESALPSDGLPLTPTLLERINHDLRVARTGSQGKAMVISQVLDNFEKGTPPKSDASEPAHIESEDQ